MVTIETAGFVSVVLLAKQLSSQRRDSISCFLDHFAQLVMYYFFCIECMKCRLLWSMIAVSVCHAAQFGFTVQKRLNESRFSLGWTLLGAERTYRDEGREKRIRCSLCKITLVSCQYFRHVDTILNSGIGCDIEFTSDPAVESSRPSLWGRR